MAGVPTDEELMAAYVAGDQAAFGEIFRRYAPLLLRLMRGGLPAQHDAGDLVQQTFLHVHRARRDFRPGGRLRPWIIAIAVNVKREHLRAMRRRPETILAPNLDDRPAEWGDPQARLEAERVRATLGRLPENQRLVVELHWLEGLSFAEIAAAVGANRSAVKVRAHRAYKGCARSSVPE
jgi:RNA polymerase sigma-70 factor (ECF subfamily)